MELNPFDHLAKIDVTKIRTPISLAAVALVLINFLIYRMADLDKNARAWLVCGSMLMAVSMLLILTQLERKAKERSSLGEPAISIDDIIRGSSAPMYYATDKLVIQNCNTAFAQILDSQRETIEGMHISDALKLMIPRVPKERRAAFRTRQKALIGRVASDLGAHMEDTEVIDNRDLEGNPFQGKYRVLIHADKIGGTDQAEAGFFVFFRLERLE